MLKELRESYVAKYESPMAARAHYAVLDGWADESTGSVDWGFALDRIGRRIVIEGSDGFVSLAIYATEREAREAFAKSAESYGEWLDATED